MAGSEYYVVPATDVPIRHWFNGLINSAIFHNRATVGEVIITTDDGLIKHMTFGEIWEIEPGDTSAQQDTGKIWGNGYTIAGDAAHTQLMEVIWTCKAPIMNREPVTV